MATESFDKEFVVTDKDKIAELKYALCLTKEQTSEERYNLYQQACLDAQTKAAIKRMKQWAEDNPLDKDVIEKNKYPDDGGCLAGE